MRTDSDRGEGLTCMDRHPSSEVLDVRRLGVIQRHIGIRHLYMVPGRLLELTVKAIHYVDRACTTSDGVKDGQKGNHIDPRCDRENCSCQRSSQLQSTVRLPLSAWLLRIPTRPMPLVPQSRQVVHRPPLNRNSARREGFENIGVSYRKTPYHFPYPLSCPVDQ